jgi:IclR family pca regulon transcriptional regulator
MEISQIARPYLENLSQKLGETVSLAVLDDFHTIYIDRIRNQSIVGVVLKIGSRLPAHCSSLGKVLLADLPIERLEELLSRHELVQFTPKTLATRDGLMADLDQARKRGYAFGDEELVIGLRAVAAPIRDSSGRAVAAVNVTGQIQNLEYRRLDEEITPALLDTVRIISILLGFTSK